ncbi:MAG: pyruvate, phosphate dikinase [Acidimicrobiales bacterium]
MPTATRYVFAFDHTHDRPARELPDLLGGKGANLAEMTAALGLPVPPGFTITTDACRGYMATGWPAGLDEEVAEHLARLEATMGRSLGDPGDPLLVSVRSGAKFSMPGMMDTVLNLGLNDRSVVGLANSTDERFAYDSYRRFVMMYGRIVLGLPGEEFDRVFEAAKGAAGVQADSELPADGLRGVVERFKAIVLERTGRPFPQAPAEQLRGAIEAVFSSWNSPRAVAYRNREKIPHDLGTAVNVQAMVFGNRDDNSGTGVGFTRNPATGEAGAYGDFLVNAQGEDVVAGIRITEPLSAIGERFPAVYDELRSVFDRLERHYRDMLDTEFTIEQGKLWMLQTRIGKRTGAAALKLAVAMTTDPVIRLERAEAVQRVTAEHLDQVLHPTFEKRGEVIAKGLAASPGAAVGRVYFTADDCVTAHERGEQVVLVRVETSPEDVHGMQVAKGILTSRGGLVSHAAVVARGWGIPAVVGAEAIEFGEGFFRAGAVTVPEGAVISIDGSTGEVMLDELKLVQAAPPPEFDVVLGWADEIRAGRLSVRANADNGPDSTRARAFGAEGIGLARTEHMFLGDRLPVVQRMILAEGADEERAALAELLEVQRYDFVEILEAMDGLPITVRLLDPPLHEFLPSMDELIAADARGELDEKGLRLFAAARAWREQNPMIGTRGVRLGIIKDGLYRMQVRALCQAAAHRADVGGRPIIEIMIPLVVSRNELAFVREWVEEEVAAVLGGRTDVEVTIGTMIETPRAALRADEIAEAADFFSFGTNDLTQMCFGFSRDDVEGRLMGAYVDNGLLPRNPFETIDLGGVGELVRLGVERGRAARPGLKMGVCGEHGGDPESIRFFYDVGVDYVSCSPFRVPIARLASAQAVLAQQKVAGSDSR